MNNALTGLIAIIVIIGGVILWVVFGPSAAQAPSNTQATTTVEQTGNTSTSTASIADRVVIDAPKSGATVPKIFTVTGKAPGNWYFEASFPIEVRNASGTVVATGHATALTDWMTIDDVAFKADITVASYKGPATLVLMNDNPSGDPERQFQKSIPITIQ